MKHTYLYYYILMAVVVILTGCTNSAADKIMDGVEARHISNEKQKDEITVQQLESLEENNSSRQRNPLAEFRRHIEYLCKEGRRAEIDNYVISEIPDFDEAAALADKEPILRHLKMYSEDHFTVDTEGICIIMADVDSDGAEDIIEYGPGSYDDKEWANRLIIYLGDGKGGYRLGYSQPLFDTLIDWTDIIEVLRYEGETYLLFCHERNQSEMNIYWLSGGIPHGKFELRYQCTDIKIEVIENSMDLDVDKLMENGLGRYHQLNPFHCDNDAWTGLIYNSDAEMQTGEETQVEVLRNKYYEKNMSELEAYLKKYGCTNRYGVPAISYEKSFRSDMNNDGAAEEFIQQTGSAWIEVEGMPDRGLSRYSAVFYGDGTYYGFNNGRKRHEGKNRLFYYMEESGKETDFKDMCGLDIWSGELIPQLFFIEKSEQGNITYIVYQDVDEFEQRLEGYLIDKNQYQHIVSVRYTPVMEFYSLYELAKGEFGHGVNYYPNLTEDRKSVRLNWDSENKLEEYTNQNIRHMIAEKISMIDWEENRFLSVGFWAVKATKDIFMMDYIIYYEVPLDDMWEEEHTETYGMEIDLKTGACRFVGRNEREAINPQECQSW